MKILDHTLSTRIARPTDNLNQLSELYKKGLGLEVLGSFTDHEGFDGVILGKKGFPYHFEFTHHRGTSVGTSPSQDHLIVFYLEKQDQIDLAIQMEDAGFKRETSYNPYWDKSGVTFEDLDGYRIVLQEK